MKIAISAESTNDLTQELLQKYDIKVIPYQFVLGNELYKDGEITTKEIFDYYKEIIESYRKITHDLDIEKLQDYIIQFPKKDYIMNAILLEVL